MQFLQILKRQLSLHDCAVGQALLALDYLLVFSRVAEGKNLFLVFFLRALAREALDMIKYHEEGDVKTGTSRTTSEMIRAMILKEEQHVREIAAEKATMKFRESQPARFACANCGASLCMGSWI